MKGSVKMFENIEDAKRMLRTRTSKIMGGYITEALFIELYTNKHPNRAYSKGWWGGIERTDNSTLTFFVVKNELNALDDEIIQRLENNGYLWKQVALIDDELYIKDRNSEMTLEDFIASRGMIYDRNNNPLNRPAVIDTELENCISVYEERGLLQEIATSIYIEDLFLNHYYTISNIDLICQDEAGVPIYAEIKFKNEFKTNINNSRRFVFGIDKFQYDYLFDAFLKCGMKVENIILYNDIITEHNVDTTLIFDFLSEKDYQNLIWKSKEIKLENSYVEYTFRTGRTAWRGQGERTVYCIPLAEYSDYNNSMLPVGLRDYYPSGAWGICTKENCEGKLVIRQKNQNEFMGCLNYRNH